MVLSPYSRVRCNLCDKSPAKVTCSIHGPHTPERVVQQDLDTSGLYLEPFQNQRFNKEEEVPEEEGGLRP